MHKHTSCTEIIGPWLSTLVVFMATLFVNNLLGAFIGSAVGWMFSITFMGGWINEGLKAFGVSAVPGSLPKIGQRQDSFPDSSSILFRSGNNNMGMSKDSGRGRKYFPDY